MTDKAYIDVEILFHQLRKKLLIIESACFSLNEILYENRGVYSNHAISALAGDALDDLGAIEDAMDAKMSQKI
ncbi:hypothetical protein BegalDRAFT_0009 [Beggiatoa alba B18LD]|uniref:Uncharacterized protein n=1 Tax=Beggiatoa alba B18LD TaxID=395493 RepID=I3CL83_9GAMM|nr:hypothetical protein [Beggiatoa alba]EIJ44376.1 hypothetical protein BegalDRAFT_0009 [Beggiatoa alba B18LD]